MLGNLWARVKALFARLFRRKPPEPGRFESDSKSALRGLLAVGAVDPGQAANTSSTFRAATSTGAARR